MHQREPLERDDLVGTQEHDDAVDDAVACLPLGAVFSHGFVYGDHHAQALAVGNAYVGVFDVDCRVGNRPHVGNEPALVLRLRGVLRERARCSSYEKGRRGDERCVCSHRFALLQLHGAPTMTLLWVTFTQWRKTSYHSLPLQRMLMTCRMRLYSPGWSVGGFSRTRA